MDVSADSKAVVPAENVNLAVECPACLTRGGKECGGGLLDKTALHRLLTNPLYSGRVTYKREPHAGEQAALVEPAVFDRVQALLKRNRGDHEVSNRK
jgi:hypothetical protein